MPGPGNEGSLHRMLEWARHHGDVTTLKRVRLMVLPLTVRERIILDKVTAETQVSTEYLDAVRDAITAVVGQECPL
ncbi:MAG: hypothetical protein H6726_03810 [Sandaracinaceae bacterium]|nr:hypothetical protein [Sandaracinaceae bacterium]